MVVREVGFSMVVVLVGKVGFLMVLMLVLVLVLVLILAKLFLRRYLIRPELNSPLVAIYSLISSSVHSVGSSSCKVLNSDSGTVAFLCFLTHTPLVRRNVRSFRMPCWLQSLKVCIVKLLKSSL